MAVIAATGGWHALAQRKHGFDGLREHAHAARERANRPRKKSVKSEIILDCAVPHGSTRPHSYSWLGRSRVA